MYLGDPKKSFVINNFSAFYAEVVRQKERIAEILAQLRRSPGEESTDADAAKALAASVSDELYRILKTQEIEANQLAGEFASAYYKEAQYIMAGLADELFLHFAWPGRDYWQEVLLEMRLFGTHVAGKRFFESLDKLLDARDSTNQEMGEIYLSALGLGFLGRYRALGADKILEQYRERLYTFVTHARPKLFQGERSLFPEAEHYTIRDANPKNLMEPRLWWIIYASTVFALLAASYGAWHNATVNLSRAVDAVYKTGAALQEKRLHDQEKKS